jgi:hypothetical protein
MGGDIESFLRWLTKSFSCFTSVAQAKTWAVRGK